MLVSSQTKLPRTKSSAVFTQTPTSAWQQKQTYTECSWNHESVRRLVLLYTYISVSVLFMCLHLLYLSPNDRAVVVTDRSFLPDNGNQLEVKWRSKSLYDRNICLTLSLVSTDSQHVAHRLWSVLGLVHPLVCADIQGEMNVDSCPKMSSIRYRKATTHSFCRSVVYWVRIQTENPYPTHLLWFFLHSYMKVKGFYVAIHNKSLMTVCERIVTQNCH